MKPPFIFSTHIDIIWYKKFISYCLQNLGSMWLNSPLYGLIEPLGVFPELLCILFWMRIRPLAPFNLMSPQSPHQLQVDESVGLAIQSLSFNGTIYFRKNLLEVLYKRISQTLKYRKLSYYIKTRFNSTSLIKTWHLWWIRDPANEKFIYNL